MNGKIAVEKITELKSTASIYYEIRSLGGGLTYGARFPNLWSALQIHETLAKDTAYSWVIVRVATIETINEVEYEAGID